MAFRTYIMTSLATYCTRVLPVGSDGGKKLPKKQPPTASGRTSRERFKRGSRNITGSAGQTAWQTCRIWSHYMCFRSTAKCNEILHKVRKTVRPAESNNSATVSLRITKYYLDIHVSDMTSPATSGRVWVGVVFEWRGALPGPTNWWTSC